MFDDLLINKMPPVKLPAIHDTRRDEAIAELEAIQDEMSGSFEPVPGRMLLDIIQRTSIAFKQKGFSLPPIDARHEQAAAEAAEQEKLLKKEARVLKAEAANGVKGKFKKQHDELDARLAAAGGNKAKKPKDPKKATGSRGWDLWRSARAAKAREEGEKMGMSELSAEWNALHEKEKLRWKAKAKKLKAAKEAEVEDEVEDEQLEPLHIAEESDEEVVEVKPKKSGKKKKKSNKD